MKIKTLIIGILLLIFFTTCKKFPEDNFISIRTIEERLTGIWKVTQIKRNGVDITETYNDSIKPAIVSETLFEFSFGRKSSVDGRIVNDLGISGGVGGFNRLYFEIVKRKKITFRPNVTLFHIHNFGSLLIEDPSFDIKELYKKKFKIKNNTNEITFTKIAN